MAGPVTAPLLIGSRFFHTGEGLESDLRTSLIDSGG